MHADERDSPSMNEEDEEDEDEGGNMCRSFISIPSLALGMKRARPYAPLAPPCNTLLGEIKVDIGTGGSSSSPLRRNAFEHASALRYGSKLSYVCVSDPDC